ncbi:Bifunctional NMN adenylyltransferase/Nudix hydrolase [Andreprevotia sp. IGB-42]|uniref:bifunctional nicotinamide-nucleotide adenylyltransferase/Nudix hydroxylase n=1 Tax=Andreprevotia sp. IGB-42 TaxID=2497473 RepID=UPI00157ED14B|nr:bifunctional nicotinamide-nucleotide adenylyltransferase/Nudix hydroxylase [Andreprevotia sp. IGB-42]KAF0811599.1 Bifunctional NMN adenylyltransferase/Nudix hydrolase [Andreprevotia sp. IGB-42]
MQTDTLVYIGRFQPFHNGHLAMLQQALSLAGKVVLVLGSAGAARSSKNPFSFDERKAMITAALAAWDASRVADIRFVGVRDYYDGQRWVAAVQQAVAAVVPAVASVGLFGHFKDASSSYLGDFPAWPLVHQASFGQLNAADLRRQWFEVGGDTAAIATQLPAALVSFLQQFAGSTAFADLQAEYRYLQHYRQVWSAAPYPPVFVTVDAVVHCCGHVLLIRRAGQPGRGNWALPGGFLDQHERVFDAAVRELNEETRLDVTPAALRSACADQALFDHPDRSLRGRTLSHAFYFKLPLAQLPAITAADDAASAQWMPVQQLVAMESTLFEDHLMILDRFLHLFDTA